MGSIVRKVKSGLSSLGGTLKGAAGVSRFAPSGSGFRPGQQNLQKLLEERVAGKRPSIADLQLKEAEERALKQAASQAASTRGVSSAGLVSRNLARQQEGIQRDVIRTGTQLRAAEQQSSEQQLGTLLAQSRGQDLQFEQIGAGAFEGAQKRRGELFKGLAGGAGNVAALGSLGTVLGGLGSDENAKKNIKPGGDTAKNFLDAISSVKFDFKSASEGQQFPEEMIGEGKQLGVLAQQVEKAGPVGRQIVEDGPFGKQLDIQTGFGALLAATAELNKRLNLVEKGKKKKDIETTARKV